MSTYGLPRPVVTFLRHMEAYKELLKWEICEGSHKLTLRLSWNFRSSEQHNSSSTSTGGASGSHTVPGPDHTVWGKLQRVLKLSHRRGSHHRAQLPQTLVQFLDKSTKKSPTSGSPLSWARISSLSLPAKWRHNHTSGATRNHSSPRGASLSPHSPPARASSLAVSPSCYSWPATNSPVNCGATGTTSSFTMTPDSVRDAPGLLSPGPLSPTASIGRISYRTEEDLTRSMEDLADRVRRRNKEQLSVIKRDWDAAIQRWDDTYPVSPSHPPVSPSRRLSAEPVLRRLSVEPVEGPSVSSPSVSSPAVVVHGTAVADGRVTTVPSLQQVNQTVRDCLKACDSILDKHSTLIL